MGSDSTLTIDSAAYAAASKRCYDLATAIGKAFDPLYQMLYNSTGMVGDYDQVKKWAKAYDEHVGDFVTMATTLANAVQNIGDLLAFAGYNYALTEYLNTGDSSAQLPDTPTVTSPLYGAENPVVTPASVIGKRGDGITITGVPGLFDHIAGPVPNGDITLLKNAAEAWNNFVGDNATKSATDTLKNISSTLTSNLEAPDLDHFADHFTTLAKGADDLHSAASAIAPLVTTHHDKLDSMRSNVYAATDNLKVKLAALAGVATVVIVATTILTFGVSLAGGDEVEAGAATGGGAALVADVGAGITSEISGFVSAVLTGAAAAFGGVTELSATGLVAIAALGVAIVSGDSTADNPQDTGTADKPGQPTPTDRLKEHLTDKDLDAARRELNGEVVATKSDGTPWDHVHEVKDAQNGLVKRIGQLQRRLGWPGLSAEERPLVEAELSEASRMLDYSEHFVPR